jgi:toxin ParE1/3/4
VASFRFSRRAEADLLRIGAYTLRTWGENQAIRYLDDLEECCQILADNPALGRACDEVRPGLRRMERGRHVVFYRREASGILVSRILHQRMLPETHPLDDKDADRQQDSPSRRAISVRSLPKTRCNRFVSVDFW